MSSDEGGHEVSHPGPNGGDCGRQTDRFLHVRRERRARPRQLAVSPHRLARCGLLELVCACEDPCPQHAMTLSTRLGFTSQAGTPVSAASGPARAVTEAEEAVKDVQTKINKVEAQLENTNLSEAFSLALNQRLTTYEAQKLLFQQRLHAGEYLPASLPTAFTMIPPPWHEPPVVLFLQLSRPDVASPSRIAVLPSDAISSNAALFFLLLPHTSPIACPHVLPFPLGDLL